MKRISKRTDIQIRLGILLFFVALFIATYITRSFILIVVSVGSVIYFLRFAYIQAQQKDKRSNV